MRYKEIIGPIWVRYTPESLSLDFSEYKKKESTKWKNRSLQMGFRFPIFKNIEHFKQCLNDSKIVDNDSLFDVENRTENNSIYDIKNMVSNYSHPRDVDRIISGITAGAILPMPIILKGKKGLFIMAGNTRQAVSRVLKVSCEVLLVDVIH